MQEVQVSRQNRLQQARRPFQLLLLLGLFAIGAVLASSGCVPRQVLAGPASSGRQSAEQGQKLFQANCAVCHGEKGDRVPVAPLNSKEFLGSRGDATLVSTVAEGKGVMPAWGKARGGPFTEDDIRSVVAYLNLGAGRTSPTLLAGMGRAVFEQNCVRCHGEKGDRIPVAPLSAKAFIDSRTDAEMQDVIMNGKGIMPSATINTTTPLTDEQARALVSYLRFGAESTTAEQARRGRELYLGNCLVCHGERGDRTPEIRLASTDYLRKLADGAIIRAIAEGKGTMPGFGRSRGGTFEVSDVAALLAYLKSWSGLPAGAALTGVEKPGEGRDIFTKNCAACHGESGDQVAGVRLKNREFLDARTDDQLSRAIAQGNARGMPAWGKSAGGPLDDGDLKKVVDYLRSVAAATAGAPVGTGGPVVTANQAATSSQPPRTSNAGEAGGDPLKGAALIGQKGCTVCHTIPGIQGANGTIGPNLKDVGGKSKIAGGVVDASTPEALKKWLLDPPALKPGTAMPKTGLSDAEASDIAAFLKAPVGSGKPAPAGTPATARPEAAPRQQTTNAGDAAKGKEVIAAKGCGGCHKVPGIPGANGAIGPDLKDVASKPKIAGGAVNNSNLEDLTKWLLDPPALKPGTAMPRVGLSDVEAQNVAAYLGSLAGGGGSDPAPAASSGGASAPPPASIAPLDPNDPVVPITASVGKELFTKNCVACHGEDGMRQPNCPLGSREWLANMPDDGLRLRIANGKPGAGMPTWSKRKGGPLSDSQIQAIIAYFAAGF